MVRELQPLNEANSRRQQEWSARFHELEVAADRHQVIDTADHDEDEPDEDPHEHGVPARVRAKVKHKR